MAYIGREPQIGNYQICDAISVVNGQAAYTMQVDSTNVVPESANHMIVSLNGVIQKPGSSYTISSSTITFASNLATGDSIDFIYLLGNTLDLGVPSDSTVTTAKLGADAVTGAKIADDAINSEHYTDGSIDTAHIADLQVTTAKIAADAITAAKIADDAISDEHLDVTAITGQTAETSIATDDLILISDTSASGALKKMTRANFVSGVGGANTPAFEAYLGGSGGQSISDNTVTKVQCQTEVYDTDSAYDNSTNYRFTPQTAGKYLVYASIQNEGGSNSNLAESFLYIKKNGSSNILETQNDFSANPVRSSVMFNAMIVDMDGSSDYVELYGRINSEDGSGQLFESDSQFARGTRFGAFRIIT